MNEVVGTNSGIDARHELLEHVPALVAVLRGPELVYEATNLRYRKRVGEGLVGRRFREAHPELGDQGIVQQLRAVLATGVPAVEVRTSGSLWREADGGDGDTPFHVTLQPLRDRTGAVSGVMVHAVEVPREATAPGSDTPTPRHRFMEALVERLPGGIAYLDKDYRFVVANPAYARFLGKPLDDIVGSDAWALLPEAEATIRPIYEGVRTTGQPLSGLATPVPIKDGDVVRETFWDFSINPTFSEHDAFEGWLVLCFEVSERVKLEREIEARKEMLERIIGSAQSGISYMNRDLVYEWVNPVQASLWGIPAEDIVGRSVFDVFGLEAEGEVGRLLRGVLESGEPHSATDFPFSYVVDGVERTTMWDFTYQPVRGREGDVVGVLVMAVEVTERRRAEEVLRESEERYRSLFEASRDAIATASLERGILDVNPAFTRMFGYTIDDFRDGTTEKLYPSHEAYLGAGAKALANLDRREPLVFEVDFKRADGTIFPAEVNSYVVRDAQGRPSRLVGVMRDLTERKAAERQMEAYNRELAGQKAFAESLIQNLPTGVAYLDRDLVFRVANPVYANFLEIPADDFIGRYLFDVLPSERSQIEPILREVLETGKPFYATEFPFVYQLPDGTERTTYWDFVYYPVRDGADVPVRGIFALADEVSERVAQQREQRELREQQERLQRERLEALEQSDKLKDQFLSILSHELRTPINAIMGFGSVLDDGVLGRLSDEQQVYTRKILSSADALLALIEDLLIVSRVQAGKFFVSPQPAAFDELAESALATQMPAAARKAIALVNHVPAALPAIAADPLRVEQVINNLVGNAIKFTPDGGQVVIRAGIEGGMLRCEVSDTGIGIAEVDVPKIFQRFTQLDMTNTRAASGVGLGLSIVKAIVDAHGGQVGVVSEPGRGATFWFTLPLEC